MSSNPINPGIRCGVCSCSHHDPQNHCTLDRVDIEPKPNANTGTPADESMCGSYRCRS